MDNKEEEIRNIEEKRKQLQEQLTKEAAELSRERKNASELLNRKVENHLKMLGMPDARFTVMLRANQK